MGLLGTLRAVHPPIHSQIKTNMKKKILNYIVLAATAIGLSSCAGGSAAQRDAGTGALIGAGAGAIIGNQSGNAVEGALIGGALGAGAGYAVGNEKDKRAAGY